MVIAIFVGMLSGIVGTLCWLLIQFILNQPGIYNQLGGNWYIVPPVIGCLAALLHAGARALASHRGGEIAERAGRPEKRQALTDLFESYHFGISVLHPALWVARGLVSLFNAFLGGTFGIEGGVIELSYSSLPLFSRYMRLFIEEKQTFVICTLSASLGVSLGAPFTGGLLALELLHALEARVRAAAVLAALMAFGTATLFQTTVFPGFFVGNATERLNILGSLFAGIRPMNFDVPQWMALTLAAVGVGMGAGLLATLTSRALAKGSEFFSQFFGPRFQYGMIATGVLMGITVWFVPESFSEPWRSFEDLAWMRLSSPAAMTLLVTEWTLLVLAFSGWGSTGIFSPMLLLGALLGYAVGNSIGVSWTLPLAIAGAASMLSSSFRVPISAAALVLEIGHDGPMWWLATSAVVSASLVCRFLKVKPLHELLLDRQGMRLVAGRAANLLASLTTHEAMYRDFKTISDHATLEEMRAAATATSHNFLGVLSLEGKYLGLLALEQLPNRIKRVLRQDAKHAEFHALERVVEIRDLVDTYSPTVGPNDSLEKALALLQGTPCVAVVDDDRKLCGFLFESSIAGRYKREIANTVIRKG